MREICLEVRDTLTPASVSGRGVSSDASLSESFTSVELPETFYLLKLKLPTSLSPDSYQYQTA